MVHTLVHTYHIRCHVPLCHRNCFGGIDLATVLGDISSFLPPQKSDRCLVENGVMDPCRYLPRGGFIPSYSLVPG